MVEGRVGELERKGASTDRITRELSDAVKSLSAEQDGLAAAAAISAKLGAKSSTGGGGGAPDASVVSLVMGVEERLQKSIQVRAWRYVGQHVCTPGADAPLEDALSQRSGHA